MVFGSCIVIEQAIYKGNADGKAAQNTSRHVHLIFKTADHQSFDSSLLKANDERHLLLLGQTKDFVIVFENPRADNPHRVVFVLGRRDIRSVELTLN